MGQFGAGGSVFGATAGAEPGNFHVLLSHVATLELSLGGVPKKKRRENGRKGRGRETRAIDAWEREHIFSGSPAPRRDHTSLARAPRPRPFRPFFLRFFSGLLKVPGWRRGKEGRGSCPVPPRLWLRRPIPRPRTDPSGFLTRRVNQTSSNPASFGLDTGDASDLRDRRLTPRDFRHPRGSPTARLFETVRVPARAKV